MLIEYSIIFRYIQSRKIIMRRKTKKNENFEQNRWKNVLNEFLIWKR